MMDLTVLYFDDCPHWRVLDQRLGEALDVVGGEARTVRRLQVTTDEQAQELAFRGSPTLLVNGADAFAEPDAPVGLSCRVYRTPEGMSGSPTVAQIVDVLRASRQVSARSAVSTSTGRSPTPPPSTWSRRRTTWSWCSTCT